jgi:hypothetical protein
LVMNAASDSMGDVKGRTINASAPTAALPPRGLRAAEAGNGAAAGMRDIPESDGVEWAFEPDPANRMPASTHEQSRRYARTVVRIARSSRD